MPKSTSAYIKLFIKTFSTRLKSEIMESYKARQLPDSVVDYIITNPVALYVDNEN